MRAEALEEGPESPLIMVFLPRKHHNEIRNEIAGVLAATEILQSRPVPTTAEGHQAKNNIEVKCRNHLEKTKQYISDIFLNAKMYPGGGTPVDCPDLVKAVNEGAQNSIVRLFPRFGEADAVGWDRVIVKVKADSKSPLEAIGYAKPTEEHPVCKEILSRLRSGSKTGNELRNALEAPPYGWPKDAIDGALIALCASEHLKGVLQHKQLAGKEIDRKNLGKMIFSTETIVLTTDDRLALRGLCGAIPVPSDSGSEAETATKLVACLRSLADQSGGDSPQPERIIPEYLSELQTLSGNSLVKALVERQAEIKTDIKAWQHTTKRIGDRLSHWDALTLLIDHADGLAILEQVQEQYDAIKEHRSLLADPDPVPPLLKEMRNGLREQLKGGIEQVRDAQEAVLGDLKSDGLWKRLKKPQQDELLKTNHLVESSIGKMDTDEAIIAQIKKTPLNSFAPLVKAIESSLPDIRAEVAKILEPKTVTVSISSGTIVKNEKELNSFLDDVRERAKDELDKGNPVMLK